MADHDSVATASFGVIKRGVSGGHEIGRVDLHGPVRIEGGNAD
jgi:hypothetical protein